MISFRHYLCHVCDSCSPITHVLRKVALNHKPQNLPKGNSADPAVCSEKSGSPISLALQKFREVQVQRNPEETSYQSDFGEFGKGVPGILSPQKEMLSASATTRKLFMGTAKAYNKMPGYQGFVPNSDRNQLAVSQSMNDHDRPDPKNHRLFNLKQYHVEIPGTMVFQPTDAANLMAASKGRMGTQTYYANAYISDPANQAIIAEKRAAQKQHGNTQATKTFFQWGKESVSENGVKNAEVRKSNTTLSLNSRFFQKCKYLAPMTAPWSLHEGNPRICVFVRACVRACVRVCV